MRLGAVLHVPSMDVSGNLLICNFWRNRSAPLFAAKDAMFRQAYNKDLSTCVGSVEWHRRLRRAGIRVGMRAEGAD